VTNVYAPANDFGLAFDDPALGIDWGVDLVKAKLSDKDRRHPRLAELPAIFD
jgi:dTDP-4-dehydrorhamnose 3,5-epimerase